MYHCFFFTYLSVYFITYVHNVLLITAWRKQTNFRCDLGEIACEGIE